MTAAATSAETAMQRMNTLVVHVVRQFAPGLGGLEDVVLNLARLQVRRGLRVRVVTLDRLFTRLDARLPSHQILHGIEVVRIPFRGSRRYPLAPAVLRHIADADIVHVHAVDFFFDALAWTRWWHGRPLVATTHGGFFHTTAHAWLKRIWFNTMTRLSARAYQAIVCCSESDLALFSQVAKDRCRLIENGVDINKFAGRGALRPEKRIVTIGRFSVNKRLDLLIAAVAELVRRDPAWRLDIVGAESDLSAGEVERLIVAAGITSSVGLHVGPSDAEIAGLLGRASLFASASDYEGFGLVAIEAMSAGLLPVLAPNAAYRALASRHGDVVLTDFTDPIGVADAVLKAFDEVAENGEALRGRLIADAERYSWSAVAEAYGSCYGTVLGKAGHSVRPRD